MGRTARNYPKGRLKLRTPKEVQPGKRYPIYIEYNWQADSLRKTTEVSVFPNKGLTKPRNDFQGSNSSFASLEFLRLLISGIVFSLS